MKQLFFLFTALALFSFSASGQSKLNKPAPHLDLQTIIQGRKNTSLDRLPSKFILIEFWATWCTPCVMNIPHINELQEKFKNKNIQFISVTDEPKEKIEAFLQKRKMNGWIGIDNGGKTFKNFGVTGRPETFIINDKGVVVYEGEPSKVTEQLLTNILSGKETPMSHEVEPVTNKLGGFGGGEDPVITANFNMRKMGYLHQEVIRPTVKANGGYGWNSNNGSVGISIIGADITHAIAYINQLPSYQRIINLSSVPDTAKWDFIFSRSKGYSLDRGRKELFNLVCNTFSVTVKDTDVEKDVFMPSFHSSKKLIYEKDIKEDDPQLKTYQRLSDIFNSVETKTGKIVDYSADVAEVYLDVFDLGTKYYRLDGKELMDWLAKQGVTFKKEKEHVKLVVLHNVN